MRWDRNGRYIMCSELNAVSSKIRSIHLMRYTGLFVLMFDSSLSIFKCNIHVLWLTQSERCRICFKRNRFLRFILSNKNYCCNTDWQSNCRVCFDSNRSQDAVFRPQKKHFSLKYVCHHIVWTFHLAQQRCTHSSWFSLGIPFSFSFIQMYFDWINKMLYITLTADHWFMNIFTPCRFLFISYKCKWKWKIRECI